MEHPVSHEDDCIGRAEERVRCGLDWLLAAAGMDRCATFNVRFEVHAPLARRTGLLRRIVVLPPRLIFEAGVLPLYMDGQVDGILLGASEAVLPERPLLLFSLAVRHPLRAGRSSAADSDNPRLQQRVGYCGFRRSEKVLVLCSPYEYRAPRS